MSAVLDACCGSRMMWFDKTDSRALFVDKRRERCHADSRQGRREIVIDPDLIADFRALPCAGSAGNVDFQVERAQGASLDRVESHDGAAAFRAALWRDSEDALDCVSKTEHPNRRKTMTEDKANYKNKNQIPEGYLRNGQGHLVPEGMVKPSDRQRDELVRDLFSKFEALQATCKAFRDEADRAIDAHLELVAEQYGVRRGGQEGNLTLSSFDGSLRIQRAVERKIEFTDEIHAAKTLIFECVAEWTADARDEIKIAVGEAFRQDAQGHLSVARILGLLRWDITDPRWITAMQAIKDSVRVQSTKRYLRFCRRKGKGYVAEPIGV